MSVSTKNPLAGGLIEVASMLADTRAARSIVQQAAFRRSLSTAYYALFHTLCQVCGDGLKLWTIGGEDLEFVYRNVDHNRTKQVLQEASTRQLHPDLDRVGRIFAQLRELREASDYSQPGRLGGQQKLLTRSEVKRHIEFAYEAVNLVDALPPDVRRGLAIRLTVKSTRRTTGWSEAAR